MQGWKTKIILFLVGQGITLFGSSIVQFSLVWYITLESSSGVWVSALTLCAFVPQVLISFVSGVWADRYNKKYLIIASDVLIALATLALALLFPILKSKNSIYISLLVVSLVRSLGTGIQVPAVSAMIPQLVGPEHLMRFNGLYATLSSLIQFASPFAAGAFLTFSTLRSSLLLDVATAVVGSSLLAGLTLIHQKKPKNGLSIYQEIREGSRYVFENRWIGKMLGFYGIFIVLVIPAGFLATLFVTRYYRESYAYMTLVEVVGFAGMSVGGLLIGFFTGCKNQVKTLLLGMLAFGILAIGMGLIDNFIVYLALMVFYGIALTVVQTSTITLLQQRTDQSVQGRVFAFQNIMYSAALPIGMMIFGPLADVVSLRILMAISGFMLVVLTLILRLDLHFYSSETTRHPHQP